MLYIYRIVCSSAASDRGYDFHAVIRLEREVGVPAARYDFVIDLDRNLAAGELQTVEQRGDGHAGIKCAGFAVDENNKSHGQYQAGYETVCATSAAAGRPLHASG